MTPPLFLVDDLDPATAVGAVVTLRGAEAHHAATVKRLEPGELALLSDGRGLIAEVTVIDAGRDQVRFTVVAVRRLAPPALTFTVVQALPKGERAELAVELLTELGVDEIVPWSAARSIARWSGGAGAEKATRGVARWRRTAAEASKQSRRARIPVVSDLAGTAVVARRIATAVDAGGAALVLHEQAVTSLAGPVVRALPASGELVLVVGPEGGIADDELTQFVAAGASLTRLGAEVMRTSTAGAAALAVLSAETRWASESPPG